MKTPARKLKPGMVVKTGPGPGKLHRLSSVDVGPVAVLAECGTHPDCALCWTPKATARVVPLLACEAAALGL